MIARNYDWFMELFVPVVIGQSNCFGFGFLTVFVNVTSYIHHKPLWKHHAKPATFAREKTRQQHRELSALVFMNIVWVL